MSIGPVRCSPASIFQHRRFFNKTGKQAAQLLRKPDIIHNLFFVCRFEYGEGRAITVVTFLSLYIKLKSQTISITPSSQVYLSRTRDERDATDMLPVAATDRDKPLKPRV
ncbi:hypothetical protein NU219Hw_g617t1 [Hortaea werneckii]